MIDRRGIRTRVLLIAAMAAIIVCTTLVSLLTIRHRLQQVVIANLSADLLRSIGTFEDLQVRRRAALDRENALLADLPTLKALMTTSDERTIQDAGAEFWKVSGNDLFALANNEKRVVAAYAMGLSIPGLASDLEPLLDSPKHTYVITNNRLFACSVQPLYFGSKASGTLLGYVISGYSIDRGAVSALSRTTGVEAIFRVGNRTIASSVPSAIEERIASTHLPPSESNAAPVPMMLGNERYLLVTRDLSASASSPLELIELKSLDQEERSIREIDGLVLTAGLVALLLGTILMTALSRLVTRPLEQLDAGVQAFAAGNSAHILPYRGTAEVRELSAAFARMRQEILQANQALLESERLATIGRMANSVSHDLRHYLAAVYANSEFLASGRLSDEERNEILGEIRTAVDGTTELLESLLIFSRSGPGIRRSHQLVATLVDRAVAMAHAHPDAAHVQFSVQNWEASETAAIVDGKQIERALYNLLLNACQTLHTTELGPKVGIAVDVRSSIILLEVKDNGDGVPEGIRSTLFDPFVSEGKQKGSGLGLTLAQCIAREHGGDVTLVSSRPGETIFRMTVARGLIETAVVTADDRKKVRTI